MQLTCYCKEPFKGLWEMGYPGRGRPQGLEGVPHFLCSQENWGEKARYDESVTRMD